MRTLRWIMVVVVLVLERPDAPQPSDVGLQNVTQSGGIVNTNGLRVLREWVRRENDLLEDLIGNLRHVTVECEGAQEDGNKVLRPLGFIVKAAEGSEEQEHRQGGDDRVTDTIHLQRQLPHDHREQEEEDFLHCVAPRSVTALHGLGLHQDHLQTSGHPGSAEDGEDSGAVDIVTGHLPHRHNELQHSAEEGVCCPAIPPGSFY
mmetsp:Transcript_67292/g.146663  ORF Transcript_67292/g.146663 Transcript_67292/m.146663 type:complete len:204 (+) Transcript_67292:193-804(+)